MQTDPREEAALRDEIRGLRELQERVRYRIALATRKLSKLPKHTGAGAKSFGAYLKAHKLGSRASAWKWFHVVDTYNESETVQLGGLEKAFQAMKAQKVEKPNANPRELLLPRARIFGKPLESVSGKWIRFERENREAPAMERLGEASSTVNPLVQNMADRMRSWLKKLSIKVWSRTWVDPRMRSLFSVRFELGSGERMVEVLKHAKKSGFS